MELSNSIKLAWLSLTQIAVGSGRINQSWLITSYHTLILIVSFTFDIERIDGLHTLI